MQRYRRANRSRAGFDLLMEKEVRIPPMSHSKIAAGTIIWGIPKGYYGRISSRSSADSEGIFLNGVYDNNYSGELFFNCYNWSDKEFVCAANDAFAQLVITPYLGGGDDTYINKDI
jgi:dUTPase